MTTDRDTTTVGDFVDMFGPCALMVACADLARHHNRIPVGFWRIDLDDDWRLIVNGTRTTRDGVPHWHALMIYRRTPAVLFNAATGTQLVANIDGMTAEEAALAALERATHQPIPAR
jgi:hypothetical protein